MEAAGATKNVHRQLFRDNRPAATMVGVTALVKSEMLVEIEVDAALE